MYFYTKNELVEINSVNFSYIKMSTWQSQLLWIFRHSLGMFPSSAWEPRDVAIGARDSFKELFPLYNVLLVLNIERIFMAYDLILIKWALIEFLCNKGNNYRFIETLFKFRKSCFDIFGNVLVCNVFENLTCYRLNLSYCYIITYSTIWFYLNL